MMMIEAYRAHSQYPAALMLIVVLSHIFTCMMNRMIGFFASKCTGLTPSSTPPCGGAFGGAVADAAVDEAIDDMTNRWGFVEEAEPQTQTLGQVSNPRKKLVRM